MPEGFGGTLTVQEFASILDLFGEFEHKMTLLGNIPRVGSG